MSAFDEAMGILGLGYPNSNQDKEIKLWSILSEKCSGLVSTFSEEELTRCKSRCKELMNIMISDLYEYDELLSKGNNAEFLARTLRNEIFVLTEKFSKLYTKQHGVKDPVPTLPNFEVLYRKLHGLTYEGLVQLDEDTYASTGRRLVFCAGFTPEKYDIISTLQDKLGDLSDIRKFPSANQIYDIYDALRLYADKNTIAGFLNIGKLSINKSTLENIRSYAGSGWDVKAMLKILSTHYDRCLQQAMKARVDISWHLCYLSNQNYMSNYNEVVKKSNAALKLLQAGVDLSLFPSETIDAEYKLDAIVSALKKGAEPGQINFLLWDDKEAFLAWYRKFLNRHTVSDSKAYTVKTEIHEKDIEASMRAASIAFDNGESSTKWDTRIFF